MPVRVRAKAQSRQLVTASRAAGPDAERLCPAAGSPVSGRRR